MAQVTSKLVMLKVGICRQQHHQALVIKLCCKTVKHGCKRFLTEVLRQDKAAPHMSSLSSKGIPIHTSVWGAALLPAKKRIG